MEFTSEQKQAIRLVGDSLLVSAAAGSGKTAVLTERVIEKLCADTPVDVSRLMILTFTEAAANEMRARISKKLRERLSSHPDPSLIRRQLAMLPSAQISTIHSACLSLLRQNFEILGLDPQFTVADEAQLTLMKIDMLSDFIDELYESLETDSDAKTTINALFKGRDDKALTDAIAHGSEFLDKLPYPKLFIDSIDTQNITAAALDIATKKISDICTVYSRIADGGYGKVSEMWGDEQYKLRLVLKAIASGNYDDAVNAAGSMDFVTFRKPKDFAPTVWAELKDLRDELKKRYRKTVADYLYAPLDRVTADRELELPIIKSYLRLCDRFNGILQAQRLSERTLSYNDLERFTLKLLIESYDGKTLTRTEAASRLSEQYDEIIVDEYQDCNLTQELIFRALSKDNKNIFVVGDVKQSIYRFRGAAPELFLKRQAASFYPNADATTLTQPAKIDLSRNFRSHGVILDFINNIFYTLMTKDRDIDYADGHALYVSDRYDASNAASVDISLYVSSDSDKNKAARIEAEAQAVAKRIKEMIGAETVYDAEKKCDRLIKASDIAVIMRAPRTHGAIFETALERAGISCINNNPAEKFLDTQEVRQTLAFLQAIDNPYDDIPLITLMYSDYFGFDVNDLGAIRAHGKRAMFFDAVKEYAKTDKKTAEFVQTLSELRTVALTSSVYGLLNVMYEKTAILTRILASKDGAKKRANLLMLCDLASGFESMRYRGLFAFITYLIKLSEAKEEIPASRLRDDPDCVNLMSIHKSKGLEFPVVFFVNSTALIQPVDHKGIMLCPDIGAGSIINDSSAHREFSGIARNIIINKENDDGINEYMRLLYVALTRAECRLFITGSLTAAQAQTLIRDCDKASASPCGFDVENGASFMKWILLSCIGQKGANRLRAFAGIEPVIGDGTFTSDVINVDDISNGTELTEKAVSAPYPYDEDTVISLISRTAEVSDIPAKLSVSEIKGMRNADDDCEQLITAKDMLKKPRFLQGGITGADRGSATHKFLQFCDFERLGTRQGFESELKRLTDNEFITKNDAALVDGDGITDFINTDIMQALLKDYRMRKEERFMFTLPASEVLDTDSSEPVTVQGVLDCLFEKDGHAIIVDYKTDRVERAEQLIDRYSIQLNMYERAVMINEGLVTDKKYIYSFALKKFITI